MDERLYGFSAYVGSMLADSVIVPSVHVHAGEQLLVRRFHSPPPCFASIRIPGAAPGEYLGGLTSAWLVLASPCAPYDDWRYKADTCMPLCTMMVALR